jgi:hypothetical protein
MYRCQRRPRRPDGETGDLVAAGRLREIAHLKTMSASGCNGVTKWRRLFMEAVREDLEATVTMLGAEFLPRWASL